MPTRTPPPDPQRKRAAQLGFEPLGVIRRALPAATGSAGGPEQPCGEDQKPGPPDSQGDHEPAIDRGLFGGSTLDEGGCARNQKRKTTPARSARRSSLAATDSGRKDVG